jgi:hypothetical protein
MCKPYLLSPSRLEEKTEKEHAHKAHGGAAQCVLKPSLSE